MNWDYEHIRGVGIASEKTLCFSYIWAMIRAKTFDEASGDLDNASLCKECVDRHPSHARYAKLLEIRGDLARWVTRDEKLPKVVSHSNPDGYTILMDGAELYTDVDIEGIYAALDMLKAEGRISEAERAQATSIAVSLHQDRRHGISDVDADMREIYREYAVRDLSGEYCACDGESVVEPLSLDFRYRGRALNISVYSRLPDMCASCDYGVAMAGVYTSGNAIDWEDSMVFPLHKSLNNAFLVGLKWEVDNDLPIREFEKQWNARLAKMGLIDGIRDGEYEYVPGGVDKRNRDVAKVALDERVLLNGLDYPDLGLQGRHAKVDGELHIEEGVIAYPPRTRYAKLIEVRGELARRSARREAQTRVAVTSHSNPDGYTILLDGAEHYTDADIEGIYAALDMAKIEGRISETERAQATSIAVSLHQDRRHGISDVDADMREIYREYAVRDLSGEYCACDGESVVEPLSLDFRYRGRALNISVYSRLPDMCASCDYGVAMAGVYTSGNAIDWEDSMVFPLHKSLNNAFLVGLKWEVDNDLPIREFEKQWNARLAKMGLIDSIRDGEYEYIPGGVREWNRDATKVALYERVFLNGLDYPDAESQFRLVKRADLLYKAGWVMAAAGLVVFPLSWLGFLAFIKAKQWGNALGWRFKDKCSDGMLYAGVLGAVNMVVMGLWLIRWFLN